MGALHLRRYRMALDRIGEVVRGMQPREKGKVWVVVLIILIKVLGAMRRAGFSSDDVKDMG